MLLDIILTIVSVIKKFHVYVLLLYFLAVYDSLSLSLSLSLVGVSACVGMRLFFSTVLS